MGGEGSVELDSPAQRPAVPQSRSPAEAPNKTGDHPPHLMLLPGMSTVLLQRRALTRTAAAEQESVDAGMR